MAINIYHQAFGVLFKAKHAYFMLFMKAIPVSAPDADFALTPKIPC
jgi:hypothetical protein